MGYYSEVAITLLRRDFDSLIQESSTVCKRVINLLTAADITYFEDSDVVILKWPYIKWYMSHYTEIDYIMNFLEREAEIHHFLRIGEDYADIEELHKDPDWLYGNYAMISREVVLCDGTAVDLRDVIQINTESLIHEEELSKEGLPDLNELF